MKQTQRRVTMDTNNAKLLYTWVAQDKGAHKLVESLYRSRVGVYFIHGEGGKGTKYAQVLPNGKAIDGQALTPLTLPEARRWGTEHMPPEVYDAAFGVTEPRRTAVRLSPEAAAAMEELRFYTNESPSEMISRLIMAEYKKLQKSTPS